MDMAQVEAGKEPVVPERESKSTSDACTYVCIARDGDG